MPGDYSSDRAISDQSFPAMVFNHAKDPLKQRWTCPGEETVAAYVDGALPLERKTRLETHLAACQGCRSLVADVFKLQRDAELPHPPLEAAKKASELAPKVRTRPSFIWAPALTMAIVVFVAAILIVRRQPPNLVLTAAPPSAPVIAKMNPVTPENSTSAEITRRLVSPRIAPVILSPSQDSTVKPDQFHLIWKSLQRSRYYEVSVVTSDGDLLWTGKTRASSLRLPRKVTLKQGSYFVWITAYLVDGQVVKSSPLKFSVD